MNAIQPLAALNTPQLSGLKKAAPAETAQVLTQLLTITNSRFNLAPHKKLNEIQIGFLVASILTTHWQLRIDEVVYVLREGIAGRLHTFDHLDEAVVMNWFAEYETKQREDLLIRHTQAQRQAVPVAKPIEAMGPMYVKQYCVKLQPDQLPAYKAQLQANHPDKPELAQAVDDYTADLWAATGRREEQARQQRERARQMLERFEAGDFTTPGEGAFGAGAFPVLPALPKGEKLNERQFEQLKDAQHTSAEEAA